MSSKKKSAAPYVEKTGRKSSAKKPKPQTDAPPAEAGDAAVSTVAADAPPASDPDRVPLSVAMKKPTKKPKGGKKPVAAKPVKAPKPTEPKSKKLSGLDAAAQVLANAKDPMNAKDLITAMSKQGLWTSPGGRTPHATLHAALSREVKQKGKDSRFAKAGRGLFAAADGA